MTSRTAPGVPMVFQPTLPARGATLLLCMCLILAKQFQPTLPARGATDASRSFVIGRNISTHAPRTGSDAAFFVGFPAFGISTHAPRTGSDASPPETFAGTGNFNPRSPHGERRIICACSFVSCNFNPRSPHGERRSASVH